MKNIILIATLVVTTITAATAQEKTAPRTEYVVELSASTLEIKPGETKDVAITFNRSKSFAKSAATLGLSSGLPEGVTVTFEPAEGVMESSVAKISVAPATKAGSYMVILNSTIAHKSKGKTLKLVVTESNGEAVTRN
ncbi:MAG TPA: hypothetical protein VIN08_27105 [Ohtaekwangia sp.]|uniref:hypothetical protein n=1 Tax=Ohtaekwangia sp. TaxID=2066019 RepID=UPI002F93EB07